jgi:predicted outer membrane protein
MAAHHHLGIVSATVTFVLLASPAAHAASARLPWAASSGLHFVEAVVNADNYRAAAGGLAMKKSPSSDVREFGRTLWLDSIEDTSRLTWLLTQSAPGVVLPSQVSAHYMFVIDELVPVSGDAFDRRFIAQQIASLAEGLELARDYSRFGDDLDLREFARHRVLKFETLLARIREIETRRETSLRTPGRGS